MLEDSQVRLQKSIQLFENYRTQIAPRVKQLTAEETRRYKELAMQIRGEMDDVANLLRILTNFEIVQEKSKLDISQKENASVRQIFFSYAMDVFKAREEELMR